jgi:hypothetical protein
VSLNHLLLSSNTLAGRCASPVRSGQSSPRDASADELCEVADLVPHLGGDVDVLRHYLPRLLEIAVTTGFDWPDVEPLVHRLMLRPGAWFDTSEAMAHRGASGT